MLLVCLSNNNVFGQYSYDDVQGVWVLSYTIPESDCPSIYGNRFNVFKKNYLIRIPTNSVDCSASHEFGIFRYGFTNERIYTHIDSLFSCGANLAYVDNDGQYDAWDYFVVEQKEFMEFYNAGYFYISDLPKKAQIVLYENSQKDHRNYAREFLDYDICGVKTENCILLDSLQQPTSIAISKGDIVVVRDTCGDVLQVEYEPEPGKYVSGYLKRNDLEFVEVKTEN